MLPAGAETSRRASGAAWLVLLALVAAVVGSILASDVRSTPVFGDTASFAMQAVSLTDGGHDLVYGAEDAAAYAELGWGDPVGLLFQTKGDGFAFAKPYLYSVALAAGLAITDDAGLGFALANAALLVAITGMAAAVLHGRRRGPAVPIVAGCFVFGSHLWLYAYSLSVELFLILLAAGFAALFVRGLDGQHLGYAVGAAILIGVVGPEKPPFVFLLLPPFLLLLVRQPTMARRGLVLSVLVLSFGVATIPYFWASDGSSWQAYAGDRFVNGATPPFAEGGGERLVVEVGTDRYFSDDFLAGTLESGGSDRLESLGYFFVGRHTGLVVFMPVALVLVVLAARHARRPEVAAVLVGLVGYAAFYVLLFPNNYWGGGVSLGNRYFLQGSPMVLALVTVAPVSARALVKGALLASAAAVLLMAPHYWHPDTAIARMDRTSLLQRLLPFEANQTNVEYFRCGALGCERRG